MKRWFLVLKCLLLVLPVQLLIAGVASSQALPGPSPDDREILCGRVNSDRVLRNRDRPYVLCARRGINVTGGATLRIEPGVTLLAEPGSMIRIMTDGALQALGTEVHPIRILGADPVPGSWAGIWLESDAEHNELAWVEIAHGGSGVYANLYVSQRAQVQIRHSVFRDSATWGIHVASSGARLPGFRANHFHGNANAPIRIFPPQMRAIDSESHFDANGRDVIEVRPGTLSGDGHAWQRTAVPFLLTGYISVRAPLEIEPGFRLLAAEGAGSIRIRTDGSIRAVGTAAEPIRFTAETDRPGAWSGLWIESDAGNELGYVEIAHGGRGSFHNLLLGSRAAVTVTNSIIRDSAALGINVGSRSATLSETGNFFRDNALGDIRSDGEVRVASSVPPFGEDVRLGPDDVARVPGAAVELDPPAATGELFPPIIDTRDLGPRMADEPDRTWTVSGSVRDAQTRAALPGVSVGLPDGSRGTITDIQGNYTLGNLPSLDSTLEFRFIGYETKYVEVAGRSRLDIELSHIYDGILAGRVRDSRTREGIQCAMVAFVDGTAVATTNALGHFAIHDLASLDIALVIMAPGYETKQVEVAGRSRLDIELTRIPTWTVRGNVTDARTRAALPGVSVQLPDGSRGTITDIQGNYTLGSLPSLNSTLVFSFIGYEAKQVEVAGRSWLDIELLPLRPN